jgi:hypothetical protein
MILCVKQPFVQIAAKHGFALGDFRYTVRRLTDSICVPQEDVFGCFSFVDDIP